MKTARPFKKTANNSVVEASVYANESSFLTELCDCRGEGCEKVENE